MRSSSDWVRAQNGEWIKAQIQKTRGLNRNFNRSLKHIFKGAATTIICRANKDDPLYRHYQDLLDGGTKPNLAKLTISRQIASIVLSVWRSQEVYDPKKMSPKTKYVSGLRNRLVNKPNKAGKTSGDKMVTGECIHCFSGPGHTSRSPPG